MVLSKQQNPEAVIKEIRRQNRRKFSPEEKIRIVLEGLRGEVSIAGHSHENRDPGQSLKDIARPHRPFIRHGKTQVEVSLFFDIVNILCSL